MNFIVLLRRVFLLFFLAAAPLNVVASGEVSIGFQYGVGIHLGQGKSYGELVPQTIRMLGFTSFRDEVSWRRFETHDGVFKVDSVPSRLRALLTDKELGRSAILVLAYGNDRYDEGGRPVSDKAIAAFAKYAVAVSKEFPNVGYLEIWNEWNHGTGIKDGSKGSADDYLRLVEKVARELKSTGSRSKIVVGALADDFPDWAFAKELLRKGVLNYADAFSVHLYNYSAGQKATAQELLQRLNKLQTYLKAANFGKEFPVLVTEFGWPTHDGSGGASERTSGAMASQFLFESRAYPWIRGVWIYELYDGGPSKSDREQNFGVLRNDGTAKDGTCMVSATLQKMKNSLFKKSGIFGSNGRWLQFEYTGRNGGFVVAYSTKLHPYAEVLRSRNIDNPMPLCGFGGNHEQIQTRAIGDEKIAIDFEPVVFEYASKDLDPSRLF
jgi:hypothetical protein